MGICVLTEGGQENKGVNNFSHVKGGISVKGRFLF